MRLVDTLGSAHPQTVSEMLAAAVERSDDALTLWDADRPSGAVYLLGYSAEMHLKSAYFMLAKGRGALVMSWDQLASTARTAAAYVGLAGADAHDLTLWRDLLVDERASQGMPLDHPIQQDLDRAVAWIDDNWSVRMRYAASFAAADDFVALYERVEWLSDHFASLWESEDVG